MRLIDADAYDFPGDLKYEPTIDAVPVVRCRVCVYNHGGYCTKFQVNLAGISSAWYRVVDDDGFCSYGQRREDGDA